MEEFDVGEIHTDNSAGSSCLNDTLVTMEGVLFHKSNWKGSNLVAMALVAKDTSLGKKPSEPISN